MPRRAQESFRGIPAHAAPLIDVEVAAALVVAAVEVVGLGDAGLRRRLPEGVEDSQRMRGSSMRHSPPRACIVEEPSALERPLVLVLLEIGQHVVPGPAGIAHLPPQVVVARLAAHVDHAVDRRAAAEHPAARIIEAAAVEARLRGGLEAPVGARIAHQVEIADGDVDPVVVVLAAGLEQQHARGRIGGEPVGEQATRGARADDDGVVGIRRHGYRPSSPRFSLSSFAATIQRFEPSVCFRSFLPRWQRRSRVGVVTPTSRSAAVPPWRHGRNVDS